LSVGPPWDDDKEESTPYNDDKRRIYHIIPFAYVIIVLWLLVPSVVVAAIDE